MNRRILLVEDEQELCMTLGDRMCSCGYEVEFAHDGMAGLQKVSAERFDLVILDLMLPYKSGLEVCAEIRQSQAAMPILMLTALGSTVDKIAGLKTGADDYVTKPFDTLELMLRVEALLRRSSPETAGAVQASHYVRAGELVLDVWRKQVMQKNQHVSLTTREFQLLWYLVEHRGETISRDELLEQVWGHMPGTQTRTVDMHIASLRQKLGRTPKSAELIVTVPGRGYSYRW